jgi:Transposase and inactivated derivatives
MPHKGKIPSEIKIEVVEGYLSGELGATQIVQKHGITESTLRRWVISYKAFGSQGLIPQSKSRKYSSELKLRVVQEYLSGSSSMKGLCLKYAISDEHIVRRWVKKYNSHEDFKQPNNGGAIYVTKGRTTTLDERIEIVSHCIANNKDYGKTIEQYEVSYQQIYGWVKKYEKYGADGLTDRRGKRKDESSMTEVEKLRAQLKLKDAENQRLQMENELLKKLEALERGRNTD